jgi:predicted GNAT family N-acyltransferase
MEESKYINFVDSYSPEFPSITVKSGESEIEDAFGVRYEVFVKEQGIDEELDRDGEDDGAVHFIAYLDETPVGTVRLRSVEPSIGKVERLAVLKDYRGKGFGRNLMRELESFASFAGIGKLKMHAQESVINFYKNLGYQTVGEEFEEAGMPHREMRKELKKN